MYKELEVIGNITFTHREIDLLACLAYGYTSTKNIAQTLSLTPRTVDVHIGNIIAKIQSGKLNSRHHILAFIDRHRKRENLIRFYERHFCKQDDCESYCPPRNVHHQTFQKNPLFPSGKIGRYSWRSAILCLIALGMIIGTVMVYTSYSSPKKTSQITLNASHTSLLPRKPLVQRLEEAFASQEMLSSRETLSTCHNDRGVVPIVAVIGSGGVGKTTLARLYGQQVKEHSVFEVNAESTDSLISSFTNLADRLIQTSEQRTTFQKIRSLQDTTERTQQLVSLVYDLLSSQGSWLLIFDNTDDLASVRPFLPPSQQPRTSDRILITTRDQNVRHSPLISSVIDVGELSSEESFNLFTGLLKISKPLDGEKKAIEAFLGKIPPFPLDISLAAHYIRDAHLSFDQYLERLNQHQPTFHQHEKKLWHEVSDYPQTRYAIITLSTARMLEQNPKYLDLLWILALADSQNIPVELLQRTQDLSLVDPFIHALRAMSFMIGESDSQGRHVFSIHRSTQSILLHYLKTTYGEPPVDMMASSLIQCSQHAMEVGDVLTMVQLVPHFEVLPVSKHLPFHITLGMLYYHTAQYAKAKRLLEDEWQFEQQKRDISQRDLSRIDSSDETRLKILIYLGNTYKELMESEKAEQTLQQALVICKQHFLHHPSEHIKLLVGLANVYRRLGNFARAEELCSQCLALCEKNNFTDYADLAAIHMALCVAHREQGHYKKAEEHIHKSLDIFEHHLSHQYLDHAHAIRLLGHVCSDQGLYLQARDLYQKSLDIFVQHQQESHPKALWLYVKLGTLCRRLGEIDRAHVYLDKAEQSEAFTTSYVVQGLTYHERAHLSIQQGDYDKALALARQSHGVYTQLFGANHVKSRRALNLVGYAAMFRGDFDEAEQCMKLALQTFTQYQLPLRCQALDYLSELYRRRLIQAKFEQADVLHQQALSYADQALSVAEIYFPVNSVHIKHLQKQRDRVMATQPGDEQKNKDMTKRCQ